MDCRESKEMMLRYVMDILKGVKKSELEEHIDACPSCRRFADMLLAEESFIRRVISRLAMRRSVLYSVLRKRKPIYSRFWSRIGITASAIAAVILLVVTLFPASDVLPPSVADAKLIEAEGAISIHPPLPLKLFRYRDRALIEPFLRKRVSDEGTD